MDGFKNSTRTKYMCGGPVKKAMGGSVSKPMSMVPVTNPRADIGDTLKIMKEQELAKKLPTKGPRGPMQGNRRGLATSAPTKGRRDTDQRNIARNPTRPNMTTRPTPVAPVEPVEPVTRRSTITTGGTPEEPGYSKGGSAKKGVPAHNSRPMIGRRAGGLAVMPKGKC